MRPVITQTMIINYAINQIRLEFRSKKALEVRFDLIHLYNSYYRKDCETSFIEVNPQSLIYFDPEEEECFYWGTYPGDYFFGTAHLKAVKNFKSTINLALMKTFKDVLSQKSTKVIVYTEQIEKQLFTNISV
jgi:hypothetical protein